MCVKVGLYFSYAKISTLPIDTPAAVRFIPTWNESAARVERRRLSAARFQRCAAASEASHAAKPRSGQRLPPQKPPLAFAISGADKGTPPEMKIVTFFRAPEREGRAALGERGEPRR